MPDNRGELLVAMQMPHGMYGGNRDYLHEGVYELSGYEIYDDEIYIHDAVWGKCVIGHEPGDEIFLRLIDNPLVSRLMNIEQLSLDAQHATMPNTTGFTRWESQWGSVAFVRKMTEGLDMDPRERLLLQLRTFLSDVGHTAFSHMGDWLFQGFGGPENQHDNELAHLIEVSGIGDLLRNHGIQAEEVVLEEVDDWIENDSPELCVDRVDYGTREIRRWLNLSMEIEFATRPEAFKLHGGKIVMANYEYARDFAIAFAMLPTEHWNQPTHRLQLLLLQESIKRQLITGEPLAVNRMEATSYNHPRDMLYSTDTDFVNNLEKVDELNWLLSVGMKQLGFEQRRIFTTVRRRDLDRWFARLGVTNQVPPFPNPLQSMTWQSEMHPLMPSNLTLKPVEADPEIPSFEAVEGGIAFYLPPLKQRVVDPLFFDDTGQIQRLSQYDPTMKRYFEEQAEVMKQAYIAVLHMNDQFKTRIVAGLTHNAENWSELLYRPRMEKERFVRLLGDAATHAIAYRKIRLAWGR